MTKILSYDSIKKAMKLFLFIFTILLPVGLSAQKAFIQVEAKPGISVYVDNIYKGKTTVDNDGLLIIDNVIPGIRTIKLIEEGSAPQEEKINIKPGEVFSYIVRPFFPIIKISETGNSGQQEIELKEGSLRIQSLPVSITIEISSLGVNYTKSKDEWMAEGIPEGIYPLTFLLNDKSLNDTVEILPGKVTYLMVDMVNLEVQGQIYDEGAGKLVMDNSSNESKDTTINNRINFPEYGITLGKTTVNDLLEKYPCNKTKNKCLTICQVESLRFYDQACDSIIDNVVISRSTDMSKTWQEAMGFDWRISYNEWIELLEKLGYKVDILEKPYIKKQKGEKSLRARVEAFSENIEVKLFFANGVEGISVNSKNTLDSIMISLKE